MNNYSLKEHYLHPRNVGMIKEADAVGKVSNPVCGDVLKLYIKVKENKISDAKFQSFGCGAAVATASILTEVIKGKAINEAQAIAHDLLAPLFENIPIKGKHCSRLAEEALEAALDDYHNRLSPSPHC